MSNLSEVRPGVWRVRVFAGRRPNGSQVFKSATFKARGKREAAKLAPEHEARLRAEIAAEKANRGTVAELVDQWLTHQRSLGRAESTLYRVDSILRQIKSDLGKVRLERLTPRMVDEWYGKLRSENIARPGQPERHRTGSTVHHYHRVLASILRQGERWEVVPKVATRNATAPKRARREPQAPDTQVLLHVLADCSEDLRLAAALAARTGMRRGELMAVRWSDIDWDRGTLRVHRALSQVPKKAVTEKATKTDQERTITLDVITIDALSRHRMALRRRARSLGVELSLSADGPVFADIGMDATGRVPRKPDWFSNAWRAHCEKHGVKIKLHALRHWHATYLLGQGVPLPTVANRLGHTQTSTTLNIYAHVLEGTDQAAAALMAALPVSSADLPSKPPSGKDERE